MIRGRPVALGAAAVALSLAGAWALLGRAAGDEGQVGPGAVRLVARSAGASAVPRVSGVMPDSVSALDSNVSSAAQVVATAAAAPPGSVSISVAAPRQLVVGEVHELQVQVGPNSGIAEITLTIQLDREVLQARAGTDGAWMAGAASPARFTAAIADTEDSVQLRSEPADRRAGRAGGSVATVQLQAVAPGSTSVMVSGVSVRGADGRAVPFSLASASLPVLVEPARPDTTPRPAAPPIDVAPHPEDAGD